MIYSKDEKDITGNQLLDYLGNTPAEVLFKYVKIGKGEKLRDSTTQRCNIVFLMKGEIELTYCDMDYHINAGSFFLLSAGIFIKAVSLADGEVLVMSAPASYRPCRYFQGMDIGKIQQLLGIPYAFRTFDIRPALAGFTEMVKALLLLNVNSNVFHEQMRKDLQLIIRNSYSLEELVALFRPIMSSDAAFRLHVLDDLDNGMDVQKIIEHSNMSKSVFYKKFSQEFNMPVNKWIQHQKAVKLYELIGDGNYNFKDMMFKLSFSSQSEFNRFCHRMYGMNPTELRDKVTSEQSYCSDIDRFIK